MHYGHSIKYQYYLDGIFIIQSWDGARKLWEQLEYFNKI